MEHYALVGNKTCGVSGMAAAAHRKKNTHMAVCGGEGRTPGAKEKGDINFHGKWTPSSWLAECTKGHWGDYFWAPPQTLGVGTVKQACPLSHVSQVIWVE